MCFNCFFYRLTQLALFRSILQNVREAALEAQVGPIFLRALRTVLEKYDPSGWGRVDASER